VKKRFTLAQRQEQRKTLCNSKGNTIYEQLCPFETGRKKFELKTKI
jgi:hypothetical protein